MDRLFIDSETTGLNPSSNSIIQLAAIPVIKGKRQKSFNEFCQPHDWTTIEQKAIETHGITISRMRTFQSPEIMLDKFIAYLRQFNTKFYLSGYNVGFDKKFLSAMFIRYGKEKEFSELFELALHDTFFRAKSLKKTALKHLNSFRLESLCKNFNIEIQAHEALSDISATIDVDERLAEIFGEASASYSNLHEVGEVPDFKEFAQLHLHSSYSMVESIPTVHQWAKWCLDNGIPGMAITDHSYAISLYDTNVINTPNDAGELQYGNLAVVHGIGLYLIDPIKQDNYLPVNLWAKDISGYNNIMKLSTLGFERGIEFDGIKISAISIDEFRKYRKGLIVGFGEPYFALSSSAIIGKAELDRVFDLYMNATLDMQRYIELIPASITHIFSKERGLGFQPVHKSDIVDGDVGHSVVSYLFDRAMELGLPVIPSSGAHFIDPDDKRVQDVLAKNSYTSGRCYHETYSAKRSKETYIALKQILGDKLSPDLFMQWIDNSIEIANKCRGIYKKYTYQLPKIEIPDHIKQQTNDYNRQLLLYTAEKCREHGRWNDSPEYVARFRKEIDIIAKNPTLNFLPYFLMYEDIAAYARSIGVLAGIARGSAGGSLLSYYLKIIHIDPIEHNLPFERFLSLERIQVLSFPDIDWDASSREPVVAYMQKKYGMGFAQIAVFSRMKVKTAIKDAMSAIHGHNRNTPVVHHICSIIPDSPQGSDERQYVYGYTDKEGVYHPGIVEIYPEIQDFFDQYPSVKTMVDKLLGVTRGLGRHASGFVVASVDLSEGYVPLMPAGDGLYMTQMQATMVEKSGLIKADLLTVNTLEMVRKACVSIKERTGIDYMEEDDKGVALIYRLPEKKKVFRAFAAADTDSSFQFNSNLMKGLLPGFAPQSIKDLAVATALGRPGALDVEAEPGISATHFYIEVQSGRKSPKYIHPDLESILKETHSTVAFQEQLIEILVKFAGYTLGEADQIRSAIAKKKRAVMLKAYDKVREETQKRGWTLEQANKLCEVLEAYSNYSFNRSHSAAYGMTGYITMYLKTYHPLEWWSAVLNSEEDEDTIRQFAILLGSKLMPPSINSPYSQFTPGDGVIHSPIWLLKGVGETACRHIAETAPYSDLEDFLKRAHWQATTAVIFMAMIKGRALDVFIDRSKPYLEERARLIDIFRRTKKSSSKGLKDETFLNPSLLDVFLSERTANTCFNKSIVDSSSNLRPIIENTAKVHINPTNSTHFPYELKLSSEDAPIKVARTFGTLSSFIDSKTTMAMVCLFEGSEARSGISKRSGREWCNVTLTLNDGAQSVQAAWWNRKKALGLPINTMCIVMGTPERDWKGRITLNITGIEVLK